MSNTVSIITADDEEHIRSVLKVIASSIGCEIVGEAANGGEAIAIYNKLKPDIVLLDINMPIMTGKDALKEIMQADPHAYVIMLTSLSSMDTVKECIAHGARNYILKDNAVEKMTTMLQSSVQDYLDNRQDWVS